MKIKSISLASILVAIAAFASLTATQLNAQNASAPADQAPKIISQTAPDYSYGLRRDEVQGEVRVLLEVTPSGNVADETVISSTQRRLDKPTLLALSKWRYAPATKDGVPVTSRVLATVKFTMPDTDR